MVAIHELGLPVLGALALSFQALTLRLATRKERVSDVLVVVLLINICLVVPVAVAMFYPQYGLTRRSVIAFVCAGFVGTVLGRLTLYKGIQRIGASRTESVKASTPFFAAIVAVVFLGERMAVEHFLGILLIVLGVAIISWVQAYGSETAELGSVTDLAFPTSAAVLFAVEPTFAKVGLNEGTPFIVGLAIKTFAATLGFLGYLWWQDSLPELGDLRGTGLRWSLAAGVANTTFILALYASLSVSPVVLVVPIIQASPLFVVLLSYVFLQDIEQVTGRLVVGVSVVVAGGMLVAVYG